MLTRWSSLTAALLFAAGMAFAAEQASAPKFEAVPAPQINLQQSDLDKTPTPEAPAGQASDPQAPAAQEAWWGELQKGLNQELDKGSAAPAGDDAAAAANAATGADSNQSTSKSLIRGIAALGVVIALILICYAIANKYGKKSPLLAGSSLGQILGRIYLSPKAELHFVRVKDRVLVVGVTANEISRVAEFDAALFMEAQTEKKLETIDATAAPQASFARELRVQSLPEPSARAVSDELASLRAELDKARQFFRETSGEPGAL
jgi:flagellar biogenesis protein FliO